MNRYPLLFIYVSLMALLFLIPVKGDARDGETKTLYKVAIDREYTPYEFVDLDGAIKGFTLLQEIGKSARVTFIFIPMDWPDAVVSLKDGSIDLINMIRTPERRGQYEFSKPHSYIKQAIFCHISVEGITDLKSLAGYRIALQRYDISKEMLASRTDFKQVIVQSKAEGFLLLNSGKVDAFLAADQAGLQLMRKYHLTDVKPAAVGFFPQDFCFATRKGNRPLIRLLNSGLKQLKKSGQYDKIVNKWFSPGVAKTSWIVRHWPKILGLMGVLMGVLTGFIVWSILLRRTVDLRTRALQESRNFLREAQRIARIGSWEWDLKTNSLQWSEEVFRIFGLAPENFDSSFETFIQAIHPDDQARVRESVHQAIRDGMTKWDIDYSLLRPDGEIRFLHEEARTIFGPDGQVVKRLGTVQDITEQKLAEEALRQSEERYWLVFENSPVSIWEEDFSQVKALFDDLKTEGVVDIETYFQDHPETLHRCAELAKIVSLNRATLALHGASSKEEFLESITKTFTPESFETFHQELVCLWKGGTEMVIDSVVKTLAGEPRDMTVYFSVCPGYEETLSKVYVSLIDITERQQAEQEIALINRALRMLSDTNQALIRITDEVELLKEICHIIVEMGGYRMAWVGYREYDEDKTLRPMAHAGYESNYIESVRVSWGDSEWGRGPGGKSLRTGEPAIVQNIPEDPTFAPWRKVALLHGCKSIISLPLISEGRTFGILCIYSAKTEVFDSEEVEILKELADNLAFGITALRVRREHQRAEKALEEKQALLIEAQSIAHIGNWWHDLTTVEIFWSEEFFRILGRPPQKVNTELGLSWIHPEDISILQKAIEEPSEGGISEQEFRIVRPNGEIRWIHNRWVRIYDEEGKEIKRIGTHQDITEKTKFLRSLEHSLEEKKILLAEIHHRVKNNLAILSSLLSLQSKYTPDLQVMAVLQQYQSRIRTMALIHEHLYSIKAKILPPLIWKSTSRA